MIETGPHAAPTIERGRNMYRYTGPTPTVVIADGVPFPLDPNRVYDADHHIVKTRPELFRAGAGAFDDDSELVAAKARVSELEAENAALREESLQVAAWAEHEAQISAHAAAGTVAPGVETATAAPGEKRTRSNK